MMKLTGKGRYLWVLPAIMSLGSLIFLNGCSSTKSAPYMQPDKGTISGEDSGPLLQDKAEYMPKSGDSLAPVMEQPMQENYPATEEEPVYKHKEAMAATVDSKSAAEKKQAKTDSANTPAAVTETTKDATKDTKGEAATDGLMQEKAATNRKAEIKYLSADDSNSCASPVIVRKLINSGKYVQPALVRTYEFLNYYNFSYPAPDKNPVAIIPAMRKTEEAGKYSLQIAVRSRDKNKADLPPLNITFLVDISGSMAGEPIDLARLFIENFAAKLRPEDVLSIVICNRTARLVLDSYQYNAALSKKLTESVFPLFVPNDITNLDEGITAAYKLAEKNYKSDFLNRVILISDGGANAGTTAPGLVGKYAGDEDKQGIYLAGLGVGEGFNDTLMNTFTDKGRGAYLFLDSKEEAARILADDNFLANFDLAVKDVRLKMVIPPYWRMEEFHGEQVSSVASEVIPQYLAPNDQMIYHLVMAAETDNKQTVKAEAAGQGFEFEVEYRLIGGKAGKENIKVQVADMLKEQAQIRKGDAIVAYAEFLKQVKYPLTTEANKTGNLKAYGECFAEITSLNTDLSDPDLADILALLGKYERTLKFGEQFAGHEDKDSDAPAAVLGISPNEVQAVQIKGRKPAQAIKALPRLLQSVRLVPQEGYKFLALSSGPVGNPVPSGSGDLAAGDGDDPLPEYIGTRQAGTSRQRVFDLHQIVFTLKAPRSAKSFSFDFNFFSAEYPGYINKNYNDTFYAILEAASTNSGRKTNIAFDPNNNSMEVDNNYFQSPFHPIPNTGTGFDQHGSTGWLRTSWPIQGGETFTLTFSIHDEGDAVYDSLVLLDNFRWHPYEAVGTTDPLN